MITNIDMLGATMIMVIMSKGNSSLVIQVQLGRCTDNGKCGFENLRNEGAYPKTFVVGQVILG